MQKNGFYSTPPHRCINIYYKGGCMDMREKKKKKFDAKKVVREQMSQALELPEEAVNNVPVITMIGSKEIRVENFNGLVEYTEQRIRLNTTCGLLIIDGIHLIAKSMTAEVIVIRGNILSVSFHV